MNELLSFLKSQRLLVIASSNDDDLWISNVFYGADDKFRLYFISNKETKHGKQIVKNPDIAFSIAWYNPSDHTDRKAVQGKGCCRMASPDEEIKTGIALHNTYFPEFAERITFDWAKDPNNPSGVWVVEPTYMKFWNDELYGKTEKEEFTEFQL